MTLIPSWIDIILLLLIIVIMVQVIVNGGREKTQIIVNCNCNQPHRKPKQWFPIRVYFSKTEFIKGIIMTITRQVDKVSFVTWPAPTDKHGNPAKVQDGSIEFDSDDESLAVIDSTTAEELDAYNASLPEGAPKIPTELYPYTAKLTTQGSVGATMVHIKADANLNDDNDATTGDDVKTITGNLTVEVLAGEASGFGEPSVTEGTDVAA